MMRDRSKKIAPCPNACRDQQCRPSISEIVRKHRSDWCHQRTEFVTGANRPNERSRSRPLFASEFDKSRSSGWPISRLQAHARSGRSGAPLLNNAPAQRDADNVPCYESSGREEDK